VWVWRGSGRCARHVWCNLSHQHRTAARCQPIGIAVTAVAQNFGGFCLTAGCSPAGSLSRQWRCVYAVVMCVFALQPPAGHRDRSAAVCEGLPPQRVGRDTSGRTGADADCAVLRHAARGEGESHAGGLRPPIFTHALLFWGGQSSGDVRVCAGIAKDLPAMYAYHPPALPGCCSAEDQPRGK
jgi:hypothetical protein